MDRRSMLTLTALGGVAAVLPAAGVIPAVGAGTTEATCAITVAVDGTVALAVTPADGRGCWLDQLVGSRWVNRATWRAAPTPYRLDQRGRSGQWRVTSRRRDGRYETVATMTLPLPVTRAPASPLDLGSWAYARGVNLSGGEYGSRFPGTVTHDYAYPSAADVHYAAARGHHLLRVPFRWERLQARLGSGLIGPDVAALHTVLSAAADAGVIVVLDCHTYGGRFLDGTEVKLGTAALPASALADLWARMAAEFTEPNMVVGPMNEPVGVPGQGSSSGVQVWNACLQGVVDRLRADGRTCWITAPDAGYQPAQNWSRDNAAGPFVHDPLHRLVFEAHYYPDTDNSGTFQTSFAETDRAAVAAGYGGAVDRAVQQVRSFTRWQPGTPKLLGEIGVPCGDPDWQRVLDALYTELDAGSVSTTYWAATWDGAYPLRPWAWGTTPSPTPSATSIERHPGRLLTSGAGANASEPAQSGVT